MPPTKLHVLHHGAMGCDLTWLLLKPGRNITDRYHMNQTVEWVDCPIHTVLIEHPDGLILWDTGAPRNWETHWAPTGFFYGFVQILVGLHEYRRASRTSSRMTA